MTMKNYKENDIDYKGSIQLNQILVQCQPPTLNVSLKNEINLLPKKPN